MIRQFGDFRVGMVLSENSKPSEKKITDQQVIYWYMAGFIYWKHPLFADHHPTYILQWLRHFGNSEKCFELGQMPHNSLAFTYWFKFVSYFVFLLISLCNF